MSHGQFPSLGFDPARGNIATVRDLAQQMKDTGVYAKEAFEALDSVKENEAVWTGDAAEAFAARLGELPKYLDDAHSSMEKAGQALATWGDNLESHQTRALELERQASEAIAAAEQADTAAQQARGTAMQTPDDAGLRDAAVAKINAANTAWDRVDEIRRDAESLRDTWEDNGRLCAEALNEAAGKAPNKAFFESIGEFFDDAGKWLKDHLGDIGDIAGIVSAVAGVLAFIPVLTPIMGPIAIGAGALALGLHAADMAVNDKWSDPNAWITLGGDVLGVIPGVGAISRGFGAAGDVIAGVDRVVDVTRTPGVTSMIDTAGEAVASGGRAFAAQAAADSANASRLYQWVGEATMGPFSSRADDVAMAMQGAVNVSLQVPGAVGLFDSSQSTTDAKNGAGIGSLVANAAQADNVHAWIGRAATALR